MFFTDDIEFTKHGYYLVNGIKTLSKFEAWQFAKGNFADIQFIYNDDLMSSYDWTEEPTEDIYELYAGRARQLRNDYDHLVLLYSGGIDSHVILETFLQNGLRLDEICTLTNTIIGKPGKFNQEVFNRAVPFVETLDLNVYRTEHLRPVSYLNKLNNKYSLGLIAHELQEHYSFLVDGEKDGEKFQSVDYIGIIAILIKEIQELKTILKKNNIE